MALTSNPPIRRGGQALGVFAAYPVELRVRRGGFFFFSQRRRDAKKLWCARFDCRRPWRLRAPNPSAAAGRTQSRIRRGGLCAFPALRAILFSFLLAKAPRRKGRPSLFWKRISYLNVMSLISCFLSLASLYFVPSTSYKFLTIFIPNDIFVVYFIH